MELVFEVQTREQGLLIVAAAQVLAVPHSGARLAGEPVQPDDLAALVPSLRLFEADYELGVSEAPPVFYADDAAEALALEHGVAPSELTDRPVGADTSMSVEGFTVADVEAAIAARAEHPEA